MSRGRGWYYKQKYGGGRRQYNDYDGIGINSTDSTGQNSRFASIEDQDSQV